MRQYGVSPGLTRYNLARSRPGAGRSGRLSACLTDSGVEEAAPGPDVGDADHDMIHDGPCLFVRGKHGRPSSRASQGMGRRPGQGTAFRSPAPAEEEGPQHIGMRRSFVVVPASAWYANTPHRRPMGQWLIDNMPRGTDLHIPRDRKSRRERPFAVGTAE